jgi:crotonobetainyl-CoA:carnitine CoA-transferase CaiB-like acyl-CoA transferase
MTPILKNPSALEVFRHLVGNADIVVENSAPM